MNVMHILRVIGAEFKSLENHAEAGVIDTGKQQKQQPMIPIETRPTPNHTQQHKCRLKKHISQYYISMQGVGMEEMLFFPYIKHLDGERVLRARLAGNISTLLLACISLHHHLFIYLYLSKLKQETKNKTKK
jgi:hypothetical protein